MPRPRLYTPEQLAERRRESTKQSCLNNKDARRESQKKWRDNNKEHLRQYQSEYIPQYRSDRKQTDPVYALNCNIRALLGNSFKRKGFTKRSKTADILGCTWEQFKQHIESQFEPWMSWDNRGGKVVLEPNTNWDLDHIIPVSNAATEEDITRLNHYTNFQPLCSYQNRFVKRNIS